MNSQQIQFSVYSYLTTRQHEFDAPYGILQGEFINKKNVKFKSVTFGRARTLDATVEIYNRNFMLLRSSRYGVETFKNHQDLLNRLQTI